MSSSVYAQKLTCKHCGKQHGATQWPVNGDLTPLYFQSEPGNYTVPVTCPHCGRDWYVVWDADPGPIEPLEGAASVGEKSSSPIRFSCPACGKGIKAPPHAAGKHSRCPACKQPVSVPRPAPAAAPPPKATPAVDNRSYFDQSPSQSLDNALTLIRRHGKPVEVCIVANHEVRLIFRNGARYVLGAFTVGYRGTGPEYTQRLLAAAGFSVSMDQIEAMRPPVAFKGPGSSPPAAPPAPATRNEDATVSRHLPPELEKLINTVAQLSATELHLQAGAPAAIRLKGDLRRLDMPPLSDEDLRSLLRPLMDDPQFRVFETTGEACFDYTSRSGYTFKLTAVGKTKTPLVLVGDPEAGLTALAKRFRERGIPMGQINGVSDGLPVLFCVSLCDGPMPATRKAIAACATCSPTPIGLFGLNAAAVDDPEICDLVFMEMRELLGKTAPGLFTAASADDLPAFQDNDGECIDKVRSALVFTPPSKPKGSETLGEAMARTGMSMADVIRSWNEGR